MALVCMLIGIKPGSPEGTAATESLVKKTTKMPKRRSDDENIPVAKYFIAASVVSWVQKKASKKHEDKETSSEARKRKK